MPKAEAAFRTIGEVAEQLDVPQHVLRFWEARFSQIVPLKSGGGRRYYRPDDIALLAAIRALLYVEGYTIRGVQRLLKSQGARAVRSLVATGEVASAESKSSGGAADGMGSVQAGEPKAAAAPFTSHTEVGGPLASRPDRCTELADVLDDCARILADARRVATSEPH